MGDATTSERWLPVIGWEGLYEVSSQGRVRSLDRWVHQSGKQPYLKPGRMMALITTQYGYRSVSLKRNGGELKRLVHTLVLEAYVGPRPTGMESLHGPAGKQDDSVENLSWGTSKQNSVENLSWGTSKQNSLDMLRDGSNINHNKTHCSLNHMLRVPNLVISILAIGRRGCLACARARANEYYARKMGNPFNFKARADEHYDKIMGTIP